MKLSGLFTAVITPFDTNGQLDADGFRHNLRYQLRNRVDGIVILGTTGEAPTLSPEEKRQIITIGIEEVKGKALLMVGTGSYSTEQTIAATLQAEEMGADGALIVTPYYNKPTQEGLYRHFAAVCQATRLPICVYNIQGRTGQNLHTETLRRLAALPSIIGVKEGSGNILQMNEVLDIVLKERPDFQVVSSDDALTLPLIALGGHGVISVVSNLVPGPMKALVQAALTGDFAKAREWHYKLLPLFKGAFLETNPIPIKTAMHHFNLPSGGCRLPLCDLIPENREVLSKILNELPSTWIDDHGQA